MQHSRESGFDIALKSVSAGGTLKLSFLMLLGLWGRGPALLRLEVRMIGAQIIELEPWNVSIDRTT